MGEAWTIYLTENNGVLPFYTWQTMPAGLSNATQAGQDYAWQNGNLFAILATLKANTQFLLCPEATEPAQYNYNSGFGTATNAWSGIWQGGTPVPVADFKSSEFATYNPNGKFVNTTINSKPGGYRIGSYGAIRWIYWNFNPGNATQWGTKISEVKNTTNVPIIFDCVWPDLTSVNNGNYPAPPTAPPDLGGGAIPNPSSGDQNNWRILINRHNYGINVLFADGSARWVALPDLGMLQWGRTWMKTATEWNNLPKS
jgi:prepilin-type processing-associated H-X9-DG protein